MGSHAEHGNQSNTKPMTYDLRLTTIFFLRVLCGEYFLQAWRKAQRAQQS